MHPVAQPVGLRLVAMEKESSRDLDVSEKGETKDTNDSSLSIPSKPKRERIAEEKTSSSSSAAAATISMEETGKGGRRKRDDKNTGGGWMNGTGPGSPDKNKINTMISELDEMDVQDSKSSKNTNKHFEDNDEIVIIPDLDEDGGDANQGFAQAPRNVHRKIPTLADLEDEVKAAMPSVEGGFDLKVLLATLVPPAQVQETDASWTFESLLREVTSEMSAPPKTVISVLTSPAPSPQKKESKVSSKSSDKKRASTNLPVL